MEGYILAHDLGTTGNKATLFTEDGTLCGSMVHEYQTFYPKEKWVEQNPEDWWEAVCVTTQQLLEKCGVAAKDVLCISFSAQMMGCLLIDKHGTPVRPMITWADSRAGKQEQMMINAVGMQAGYQITGHRLSASYSAAKLLWVKENEPENYKKAAKMIHAKDYMVFRLTGKILSDYSDASSTNLMDLKKKVWSTSLLEAFGIDRSILPDLVPSTTVVAGVTPKAALACGLLAGTPVVMGGGDGSCACVGAGVVEEGKSYNVIGTSSWISYAARSPLFDPAMRTFNWVHLDHNLYTPCGTMQAAGYSYNWYKRELCQYEQETAGRTGSNVYKTLDEQVLASRPGANGALFLPYLMGERSPLWNLNAQGSFVGLTANTKKADMTRAVLEGVAFNLKTILDILEQNKPLEDIIMIGGGAKGTVWLEIMANIWNRRLVLPKYSEEATSMGAAICGGVGIGLYKSFKDCASFNPVEKTIEPNPAFYEVYEKLYPIFRHTYESLAPVFEELTAFRQEQKT